MISRALPSIGGSGGRDQAVAQLERHNHLAAMLAQQIRHWSQHFETPISDEMRADAARRIAAHREAARDYQEAIAGYDAPTVDDRPEMLRGGR